MAETFLFFNPLRRQFLRIPSSPLNVPKSVYSSRENIWRIARLLKRKDKRKFRYRILPQSQTPNIGIIGAPLVYGQPLVGACSAPTMFRDLGVVGILESKGAKVKDYGDLEFKAVANDVAVVPGCNYAHTVGDANRQIADAVSDIVKDGQLALVLGGDHSIGLGSVSGHARVRQDVAVLWVDAHADINTPTTSTSGNLHGMPVSFLVKELPHIVPRVPGLEWCEPCISARNIAYIGLRSIDPGELMFLRTLGICHFTMEDIWEFGIDTAVTNALNRIDPDGNRPIHLSFDVDSIDPNLIPATGTPVPNGLDFREALSIARIVHNTRRLSVMDVVELNPLLSSATQATRSAHVMLHIIAKTLVGKRMRRQDLFDNGIIEAAKREDLLMPVI